MPPPILPNRTRTLAPQTYDAVGALLKVEGSLWSWLRAGAPLLGKFTQAAVQAAAGSPTFWTSVLSPVPWLGIAAYREELRKRRIVAAFVADAFVRGISDETLCLSPASLLRWGDSEGLRAIPLAELSGLYRLLLCLVNEEAVIDTMHGSMGGAALARFRTEIERAITDRPCAHRTPVQSKYASFVATALAAYLSAVQSAASRQEYDQMQQGLLDAAASILEILLEGELDSDLGVNFMHLVPASGELQTASRTPGFLHAESVAAYGDFLRTCPEVLLVGPTTEAAQPFARFFVPVYHDDERVLPGAPRAVRTQQPQALYGNGRWLEGHWPRGLPALSRDALVRFFGTTGFKFCVSIPVLAGAGHERKPVGVLNVNTRREPAPPMAASLAIHTERVLKPLLVLLGQLELARRAANALPI